MLGLLAAWEMYLGKFLMVLKRVSRLVGFSHTHVSNTTSEHATCNSSLFCSSSSSLTTMKVETNETRLIINYCFCAEVKKKESKQLERRALSLTLLGLKAIYWFSITLVQRALAFFASFCHPFIHTLISLLSISCEFHLGVCSGNFLRRVVVVPRPQLLFLFNFIVAIKCRYFTLARGNNYMPF